MSSGTLHGSWWGLAEADAALVGVAVVAIVIAAAAVLWQRQLSGRWRRASARRDDR